MRFHTALALVSGSHIDSMRTCAGQSMRSIFCTIQLAPTGSMNSRLRHCQCRLSVALCRSASMSSIAEGAIGPMITTDRSERSISAICTSAASPPSAWMSAW